MGLLIGGEYCAAAIAFCVRRQNEIFIYIKAYGKQVELDGDEMIKTDHVPLNLIVNDHVAFFLFRILYSRTCHANIIYTYAVQRALGQR